ncbi:MAG TPA: hypothetical protein VKK06_07900, partial [Terriglobia bacterium]|nr:hypothetical protein [Terriglobia bacterium]
MLRKKLDTSPERELAVSQRSSGRTRLPFSFANHMAGDITLLILPGALPLAPAQTYRRTMPKLILFRSDPNDSLPWSRGAS